MTWANRRKNTIGLVFALIIAIISGFLVFKFVYVKPSCFDGIRNQNEIETDCGGRCERLCASSFLPAKVSWARADMVVKGVYNLGAYVINPNLDGKAGNVKYVFKVYDNTTTLIGSRSGSMYIAPQKNVLAFESNFQTKESVPARVTFEFTEPIEWERSDIQNDGIIISNKIFSSEDGGSNLSATLKNSSLNDYKSFNVYAILYDKDGNVNGFSKTVVDKLDRRSESKVFFTWPNARPDRVTDEIIPVVR